MFDPFCLFYLFCLESNLAKWVQASQASQVQINQASRTKTCRTFKPVSKTIKIKPKGEPNEPRNLKDPCGTGSQKVSKIVSTQLDKSISTYRGKT